MPVQAEKVQEVSWSGLSYDFRVFVVPPLMEQTSHNCPPRCRVNLLGLKKLHVPPCGWGAANNSSRRWKLLKMSPGPTG